MKRFLPVLIILLLKGCMRGQFPFDLFASQGFWVIIGIVLIVVLLINADSKPQSDEDEQEETY